MQRVLSSYAGELLKRLPKTAAGGTSAQPPYAGTDWHVRLPEEEEGVLCSILATAEYCRYRLNTYVMSTSHIIMQWLRHMGRAVTAACKLKLNKIIIHYRNLVALTNILGWPKQRLL